MHPLPDIVTVPLLVASAVNGIWWIYSLVTGFFSDLLSAYNIAISFFLVLAFAVSIKARHNWERRTGLR